MFLTQVCLQCVISSVPKKNCNANVLFKRYFPENHRDMIFRGVLEQILERLSTTFTFAVYLQLFVQ